MWREILLKFTLDEELLQCTWSTWQNAGDESQTEDFSSWSIEPLIPARVQEHSFQAMKNGFKSKCEQ